MVVTWTNLPPYVSDCYRWRWYYYYYYRYRSYCGSTRVQNMPVNNFQAVLMTDGQFAFVKFIYPDINWFYEDYTKAIFEKFVSSSIRYGMPVAGYSAGDGSDDRQNTYYNMQTTGKSVMADLDTVVGNTGEAGIWMFRLEENSGQGTAPLQCYQWAKKEYAHYSEKLSMVNLEPCPCSMNQAWRDLWFRFKLSIQDYTRDKICFRTAFRINNLRRRCCYSYWWQSYGSLLVGSPNGGHVVDDTRPNSEEYGYQKCCIESSNMCQLFYVLLPSSDCEGYNPPRWRTNRGDPHLVTLDGLNYTFNGLGEFTLLDVDSGEMQVQARTRKVSDTSKATVFSSVAIQLVNHSLTQVNLKNGTEEELEVFINCTMIDIGNFTNDTSTHSLLSDTVLLSRPENNSFQVTYENGITVSTKALKGALSISFAVPVTFENRTQGLMGVFNNDKSDDLTPSNGAPIPETSSEGDIYHQFGMTWMVTNETTIFCYQAGESYEIYNFPDFTPMFTDNITFANATLQAAAEALCGSDMSCLFDTAQTGDLSFGEATLSEKIASDRATSDLDNFPPKITGPRSHKVDRGVLTTITTNVSDANGDTITCQLETNGSTSANLSQASGDEYNVDILINSISEELNLKLIAQDTNDARSTYQPVIEYCPCENGGTCASLTASELEEASS
ncbi:mucin-like protein [Lingula anatina]|uniref:Mucin-like protein n=1 Tax=Lingula anatina TaxID=7574 RepID=A0A1S3JY06_LINAN|nr:mucin-like protein [Lingula anatina]|eukprot:XP_013415295.1 mucin-like protein [Lingula anatina]